MCKFAHMIITTNHRTYILRDIIYIEADGAYSHIHTPSRVIRCSKRLKQLETDNLIRISKKHLVNPDYIDYIEAGHVILKDKTSLAYTITLTELKNMLS